jgi:hypothetical protein
MSITSIIIECFAFISSHLISQCQISVLLLRATPGEKLKFKIVVVYLTMSA